MKTQKLSDSCLALVELFIEACRGAAIDREEQLPKVEQFLEDWGEADPCFSEMDMREVRSILDFLAKKVQRWREMTEPDRRRYPTRDMTPAERRELVDQAKSG